MHRTEGANNVAGLYTEGPPATTVTDDAMNAIQEEIVNVITGAGLTLKTAASDTYDQLRQAILQTAPLPRGMIDGLVMSNAVDADHDITIAVGKCRNAGDSVSQFLNSSITKQIDAAWALGSNAGGFPTGLGVVAADTWYNVFVISNADGSITDGGYDTSLIATNLLADAAGDNFTVYRRIGSVLTDGSNNILPFIQVGDRFWLDAPINDYAAALSTVSALVTMSVPVGVKVKMLGVVSTPLNRVMFITPPDVGDYVADAVINATMYNGSTPGTVQFTCLTNTSAQVRVVAQVAATTGYMSTLGWEDFRGKDA